MSERLGTVQPGETFHEGNDDRALIRVTFPNAGSAEG
jgi:hypothetical protein